MKPHAAPHAVGPGLSWVATIRGALRALTTRPPSPATPHGGHAAPVRAGAFGSGPALLVVTAFVTGCVAGVTADQLHEDAARTAQVAADSAATAHSLQVESAASERLSGQATAYFAQRRTTALDAAQTAVSEVGVLTASVRPIVGTETLAPLDEAVTALAALVGNAPTAPSVLLRATATAAADRPVAIATVAPVAPTTPGADVLSLVAAAILEEGDVVVRTGARDPVVEVSPAASGVATANPSPSSGTVTTGATADETPIAPSRNASAPGARAPGLASGDPTPVPHASSPPADESTESGAGATLAPTPQIAPPASSLDEVFVLGTSLAAPTVRATALATAAAGGLDVATSEQILSLVAEIRVLSTQVQATADTVIAEQKAQAEAARVQAEAEARAQEALARAVRSMRTRIAATKAAPIGDIPAALLCGVSFTSGVLLRCDAAAALDQMDAEFRQETGRHLVIGSSYRTTPQQELLRATKGELAALPGTSNHERALAIDFTGAGSVGHFDAPTYLWLVEHAQAYGWHHPAYMDPGGSGPLEPWHWEFDTE